ncbi:heme peroxidase [Cristinia sonorae]|uniref:Heme peroxidase n=1 Tax=Cristinia sonorae TaxID=1940300 RepID=A0A8K0XP00_9AGAR|nr:heme peroxidase [Cristinia sonorae]
MSNSKIVALADAAYLADRPLPNAPDGRYDAQVRPASDPADTNANHSALYKLVTDVEDRIKKGPIIKDPKLIPAVLDLLKNGDAIDDRKGLFTMGLSILCQLPQDSEISKKLNDAVISVLYRTLAHPPATYVGSDVPFATAPTKPVWPNDKQAVDGNVSDAIPSAAQGAPIPRMAGNFRTADGSGNNPLAPEVGQAGQPYARSVQGKHPLPRNMLPETSIVFDSLLKARDWQGHPGGNSSLTFAYASLVTHQLFRTDPRDMTKNNTSSYLDLSILYGINQQQQDMVRNKAPGRGLLWPDAFAEDRLILVPPAASALLVIFSRNHNYIAANLLNINERGRWTNPPPEDPVKRAIQDEEIFQTARLVNCGHFMAMIFGDYVAGFLGLGRDGSSWSMNPFDPIKMEDGTTVERGEGNHCSVEFNILYRWHATTAQNDIAWTEDVFKKAFNGKPFDQLELKDFVPAVSNAWKDVDPNPRTRTFAWLQRQDDGTFKDDDLARVLQDATESMAGAYRARGTPSVLRIIEIVGMEQARAWGVCTMNEFRKFLNLKPFETFEEWNSDPEIAGTARQLYGHIDNLELYPGLQAEDCMPLGPGSGICCGYTMTRAILGDAIALVRGDRFYTTDYTPGNLTTWGFQDCARDPNNGAFGAALPKLLFRHLPRHYPANSVYALYPFFTPEVTRKNLTKLGIVEKYSFDRPKALPIPKVVDTVAGIKYVFNDSTKFKTTYGDDMRLLTRNYGFFLVFEDEQRHSKDRSLVLHSLFPTQDSLVNYVNFYKTKTLELLKENSYKISGVPGTRVDIVRNVINLVSVHWAADYLIGIPLKTKANPKGMFTEQEVYDIFSLLFTCVFINVQPEHGWTLRTQAKQVGDVINSLIEKSLNEVSPKTAGNPIVGLFSAVSNIIWPASKKPCYPFLSNLAQSGRPIDELVGNVIGLAVGSSVNYAQAVAQVVDFYLDDERAAERADIISLCRKNDAASLEKLRGYVREGQRLNPQFAGLLRVSAVADTIPLGNGNSVSVQPGDIIFNSFRNAQTNPADFPDPFKVDPTRPKASYSNQGTGFHGCPGVNYAEQTIPEILKIVFSLKNVRRAPGAAGKMAGFMLNQFGTDNRLYLTDTGNLSPWPGSLTIVYDE